jgi:hypothetical protein
MDDRQCSNQAINGHQSQQSIHLFGSLTREHALFIWTIVDDHGIRDDEVLAFGLNASTLQILQICLRKTQFWSEPQRFRAFLWGTQKVQCVVCGAWCVVRGAWQNYTDQLVADQQPVLAQKFQVQQQILISLPTQPLCSNPERTQFPAPQNIIHK